MYFSIEDIQSRRKRLEELWDKTLRTQDAILIHSGDLIAKPGGLDQKYQFMPHPAFFWLTGRRREGEVLLYNKDLGWVEFQKEISSDEAIWEGERNDVLVNQTGVNVSALNNFIAKNKFNELHHLAQVENIKQDAFELQIALDRVRRQKDNAEIKLIKQIAEIANFGYKRIEEILRPGISEKEIQISFEAEIYRRGSHTIPYDTIVGSGSNSSILHALPSKKLIEKNEFVLIDAGADIYDYCVDITRTFYSSEKMSSQHRALYQLVSKTQNACIVMLKAGVLWKDVHGKAATVLTEGLLALGILKGDLSDLIKKEVVSLFFPHGVGHLVGLRVRDTGQVENLNPKSYFGARLRIDLELEENHIITVEPGCYFMKSILENSEIQRKFKHDVSWRELEKWKHIGGVRIEDNLLIQKNGSENLTECVGKTGVLSQLIL